MVLHAAIAAAPARFSGAVRRRNVVDLRSGNRARRSPSDGGRGTVHDAAMAAAAMVLAIGPARSTGGGRAAWWSGRRSAFLQRSERWAGAARVSPGRGG